MLWISEVLKMMSESHFLLPTYDSQLDTPELISSNRGSSVMVLHSLQCPKPTSAYLVQV
jgi:hypothetical protein